MRRLRAIDAGFGWLKRTYPDAETYQVAHETLYRSLFIPARGALKKELMAHLRRTSAASAAMSISMI